MALTRRALFAGALALGAAAVGGVALFKSSDQAAAGQPAINTLEGGRLAIHGYDPVAYFVDGGPRKGRADLTVEHGGAIWRFASEANKRRFEENSARYTPVYGGYCAYGVAQGYLVKIDPDAWSIVDDRLYLNYDKAVQNTWLKDVAGYVRGADARFPALLSGVISNSASAPANNM